MDLLPLYAPVRGRFADRGEGSKSTILYYRKSIEALWVRSKITNMANSSTQSLRHLVMPPQEVGRWEADRVSQLESQKPLYASANHRLLRTRRASLLVLSSNEREPASSTGTASRQSLSSVFHPFQKQAAYLYKTCHMNMGRTPVPLRYVWLGRAPDDDPMQVLYFYSGSINTSFA